MKSDLTEIVLYEHLIFLEGEEVEVVPGDSSIAYIFLFHFFVWLNWLGVDTLLI